MNNLVKTITVVFMFITNILVNLIFTTTNYCLKILMVKINMLKNLFMTIRIVIMNMKIILIVVFVKIKNLNNNLFPIKNLTIN
jgi:hypothetical protein